MSKRSITLHGVDERLLALIQAEAGNQNMKAGPWCLAQIKKSLSRESAANDESLKEEIEGISAHSALASHLLLDVLAHLRATTQQPGLADAVARKRGELEALHFDSDSVANPISEVNEHEF